jgi:hypothetical protein
LNSIVRTIISKLFGRSSQDAQTADLDHLTRLVRRYSVEQQQVPKSLIELVSLKYLEAVPVAPPGHKFIIDRKRVEVRLE